MTISILKKFQTYQTNNDKIHQLKEKINNYEKRRKFLCTGISFEPKLLEFDNYYMGLKRKLSKAQGRKRNAIDSLAKKLGVNQPLGEYESLLADLVALLTEKGIDIKNQFYDLLLAYKQIEAEYQTKCRDNRRLSWENQEREREREQNQEQLTDKTQDLDNYYDLLEIKNQRIAQLAQTVKSKQVQINGLQQRDSENQELIDEYIRTITYYQNQINDRRETENRQSREINSLRVQLTYYQDQDNRLRETIQTLQNENQQVIIEKNDYLTETEELNQDLDRADNLLANKNQQITSLIQQSNNLNTANQNHSQTKKKLNKLKKAITREGKKWKKKNQDLIKDNLQAEEDLNQVKKQNQGKIKRVQQQLTKKRKQVKSLKQNNANLKKELNQVKQELLRTQQALNNQSSEINCSHSDYNQLKEKVVRIQEDKEGREKEIVAKFITEFDLNQEQNNTIEQIINAIKTLLDKPPIEKEIKVENIEKIQELEKGIEGLKNTVPFGENLGTIKHLELNSLEYLFKKVDTDTIKQIKQATNYQQVVIARQNFLKKYLESKQKVVSLEVPKSELTTHQSHKERYILISLLVISLVSIGRLLHKLRRINKQNPNKR